MTSSAAKAAGTTATTSNNGGSGGGSSVARTAAKATLVVIVFVLLSRVLGVIRSIAIARIFGQNTDTDIYNRSFAVPDMLQLLLAGGALSTVFIPVFTEYLNAKREDEAFKTFGLVVTKVALAAAAVILLCELLAPLLVRLAAPNFSPEARAQMVPLTRILLPAQWFFFVGGLIIATLQARGRFVVAASAPLVYNAGIIGGALLFGPKDGVIAMTWGALIGAALGNFALPLFELLRTGGRLRLGFDLRHPGVVQFGRLLLPALLGLGLSPLCFLITGFFLDGGGRLTALRNGYELMQAPLGIFAQASAIVLFPTISLLAAQKDWPAFRNEVSFGIRRILFLTLPASLLMAVLAEPIIRLLYAGDKFGPREIANAALALRLYSLGTFAWSVQAVLGRGFFALQDTRTPLRITKAMIALFGVLSLAGWLLGMNFGGYALIMSIVATVNMIWFLIALGPRVGGLDARGIARSGALITLASVAASAVGLVVVRGLGPLLPDGKLGAALTLMAAGGIALAVYVGVCAVLRLPELRGVRAMFRRPPKSSGGVPIE